MANKFIIEDNQIKFGNVEMHFQLASDISQVECGGHFVKENENDIVLFGRSIDFGTCEFRLKELKEIIKNKNITPPSFKKFNFYYLKEDERIKL